MSFLEGLFGVYEKKLENFEDYEPVTFNETLFVGKGIKADVRLYINSKFRAGLTATIEQQAADY